jgi:hypothetical protein
MIADKDDPQAVAMRKVPLLSTSNFATWKRNFLLATYTLPNSQKYMESGVLPDLRLPEYGDVLATKPSHTSSGNTAGGSDSDDDSVKGMSTHLGAAAKPKVTTLAPTVSTAALTPVRRYTDDETGRTVWKEDRSTQKLFNKEFNRGSQLR